MKGKLLTSLGLVLIFVSVALAGGDPIPEGELESLEQQDSLDLPEHRELISDEQEAPEILLRSGTSNPFGTQQAQTEPRDQDNISSQGTDISVGSAASIELVHKMEISISGGVGLDDVVSASFVPFPSWALDKGQCRVFVRYLVEVNSSGNVASSVVTVTSSGDPDWDYAVRDAVRGWRFASSSGGGPRKAWVSVTYNLMMMEGH